MFQVRLDVHLWYGGSLVRDFALSDSVDTVDRAITWYLVHHDEQVIQALKTYAGKVDGVTVGFRLKPSVGAGRLGNLWEEVALDLSEVITILPELRLPCHSPTRVE